MYASYFNSFRQKHKQFIYFSDNPSEPDQNPKVLFKPTNEPQFVTVSGAKGEIPYAIVLDPGRYTISVKNDKYLFLDYFVLLPAAYYEASILAKQIENPCELGDFDSCRHYKYPPIDEFRPVTQSFDENGENAKELYTDNEHVQLVKLEPFALLNEYQQSLTYVVDIPQSGKYIVVVDYITERKYPELYVLKVNLLENDEYEAFVSVPSCLYSTVCRQPVIDEDSKEQLFTFNTPGPKSFRISVSKLNYFLVLQKCATLMNRCHSI